MSNFTRPILDALGRRIKYANSPRNDQSGFIQYDVDHSDPAKWDQATGLPTDTHVSISVTRREAPIAVLEPGEAVADELTETEGPSARVSVAATGGLDAPPVLLVPEGTTVGDASLQFARKYGSPEGSLPFIGGQEVGGSTILTAGDIVLLKVPVKRRGL